MAATPPRPPTLEALADDLQIEKALGFNAVRDHMKVEPQQWYYDTDRLGLLVWQDMPAMAVATPSAAAQQEFLRELHAIVNANIDHPSIVQWIPFNEGWGQFGLGQVTSDLHTWDPTRLVDTISGYNACMCGQSIPGDVQDQHAYPNPAAPAPSATQATEDGEFGGLALRIPGHVWPGRTFGYEQDADSQTLISPVRRSAHRGRRRGPPRRTKRRDLHAGHRRRGRDRRTHQL